MAEITFDQKFIISSDFPSLNLDDADHLYEDFLHAENAPFTIHYVSGKGNLVADIYIGQGEAYNIPMEDVFNIGTLSRSELQAIGVGNTKEVYKIKLGRSEDDVYTLYFIVDVTITSNDTSYTGVTVDTYFQIDQVGALSISYSLDSFSYHVYAPDPNLISAIRFGLGTFTVPGADRTDALDNRCFVALLGCSSVPAPNDNMLISRSISGDDIYYALGPGRQIYTATAATYTRASAVVDLAKLSLWKELVPEWDFTFDFIPESPEAGPESEPGGYNPGSDGFNDSSDTIGLPDVPTIGVTNVGFINVYKTQSQSLQNMGVELFPPLSYAQPTVITANDVTDAVVNGFNAIVAFLANIPSFFDQIMANTLINYVIDCHVIPVTPSGGTSESIKVGPKTLQASGDRLSNDYVTVDCGTISLAPYYDNFADFSATDFRLHLPFVGFVPGKPEWFYRESLNVTYRFNIIDGSFMAFVRSTGAYVNNNNAGPTIVGQYGGNACVHLPITGVTYASMVSGLVGAGTGAVAGAASGNVGVVATSALAAANAHGNIAQSNSYSSSVAFLGCRRPFILIERAVSNFSKTYAKELGIPSNISRKLGNVTGFSVIGDVHLDGISATDAEKAEIERLLHEGVIL